MSKKIAVIRFSALGDVAMLVPILRLAKIQHPNIKLHVFTKKPFDRIFHIADIEATGINFNNEYKGIVGLKNLAKKIDHQGFDCILDMHLVLRTLILDFFSHTTFYRLDKGRSEKKAMIKAASRPEQSLPSMHKRYAAVFQDAHIKLNQKAKLDKIAVTELPKLPFLIDDSDPLIGIAPFSAHPSKEYPLEQMKVVIKKIQDEARVNILLFGGGKEEEKKLNSLADEFNNVHSTAGILTLEDQIKWMSQLKLMLSMDSGNGHLAAAMGIQVITVWGATHPYLGFKPYNQPHNNQLLPDAKKYPAIPVSVFGKTKDKYYANAIASIEPSDIVQQIMNHISD